MEEIDNPAPAPEAVEEPTPWIERATTTVMIVLLTIPVDLWHMYSANYKRMSSTAVGLILIVWVVTNLVIYLSWSGLWALVSKVFLRQAHFFGHLNTIILAGLTWTCVNALSRVGVFALSLDTIGASLSYLLLWTVLSTLFWGHLRLVSTVPIRRLAVMAGLVGGLFVGIAVGARMLVVRQFPAIKSAEATLLPPFLLLRSPVSVQRHLDSLVGLQASVDARAKEEKQD